MKKVLAITIVAGLLIGLASAAMAAGTATDWTVLLRATDTSYGFAASLIQVGTATGKTDGKDSTDSKYTPNSGNQAQVVAYEPSWPDTPPYYNQDKKAPITDTAKTWDLVVWAGSSYTGNSIRLAWWSTSTLSPIDTGAAAGWTYTIKVVSDPTSTYAVGKSWTFTPGAVGTSAAPVGYADFGALKLADNNAADSGIRLQLIAGPSGAVITPEPSSMVALASGLFGLVGFGIRRRK